MSTGGVFIPSSGDLVMKDNLAHGLGGSMDTFRKNPRPSSRAPSRSKSRPGTQGTARFGALSHNSFFARHNPHPGRVRHIKGLLDVPICAVNDEMIMANPHGGLQFPPSNHEDGKLKTWSRYHIPSNAINVNTQTHPINTITGLQYFLGKPLNFRIYSEAINPRKGLAEVPETWQDELRAITEAVITAPPPPPAQAAKPPSRQKTQYSETTGRLIPPPSRAMSRGNSRASNRGGQVMNSMAAQFNIDDPEPEYRVMQLLCQILQTEDINAVKQWLVGAGEREKTLVMDMIKAAMTVDDKPEYQLPAPEQVPVHGCLGDDASNQDRLTIERVSPRPMTPVREEPPEPLPTKLPPLVNPPAADQARPVTSDAFKPPMSGRLSARPISVLARPKSRSSQVPQTPREAKLKYTNTDTWNQDQSMV